MSSDKRVVLAFALSFLVLILYPIYLKWVSPPSSQIAAKLEVVEARAPLAGSFEIKAVRPQELGGIHRFSHEHFNAEFSELGGIVTKLELKHWKRDQSTEILIDSAAGEGRAFLAGLRNQGIDFSREAFEVEKSDEREGDVSLRAEIPGAWRMTKRFHFASDQPVIWIEVEVENLSASKQVAALEFMSQMDFGAEELKQSVRPESFIALGEKLVSTHVDRIKKKPQIVEGQVLWSALGRKYFAVMVHPEEPFALAKTTAVETEGRVWMRTVLEDAGREASPGIPLKRSFMVYAGPQYRGVLKSFDMGFEGVLSHGVFGAFRLWLLIALEWTHKMIGNYGWAIVLITIAIKLLFAPLTHMSFASMKKMQALQPQLKSLQERHKNDQARSSKEMMELYKKHKVNPMGGCLPMVLQIPIFIAFYQVLAQTVELKGEPFIWWIRDLSAQERAWTLPFSIPFVGDAVNILPLLMTGSMVWQQQLTPQTGTPEQQKMMMLMPLVFAVAFYQMPSGLVLYWFVNNLLSILHQLFIKGKALPHHAEA